jgi:mycofactocin precursor
MDSPSFSTLADNQAPIEETFAPLAHENVPFEDVLPQAQEQVQDASATIVGDETEVEEEEIEEELIIEDFTIDGICGVY